MKKRRTVRVGKRGAHVGRIGLVKGESPFAGKFLKTLKGTFSEAEAKKLVALTRQYQGSLREAGIDIREAEVKTTGHKERRIHFIQEPFPEEQLLAGHIKGMGREQFLSVFRTLLDSDRKIQEYNRTHTPKIWIDPNPQNYALVGERLVLFDFFPPVILGEPPVNRMEWKNLPLAKKPLRKIIEPARQHFRSLPATPAVRLVNLMAGFRPEFRNAMLKEARDHLKARGVPEKQFNRVMGVHKVYKKVMDTLRLW